MTMSFRVTLAHIVFYFFVILTLVALAALAVTGSGWFWLAIFGSPSIATLAVLSLPHDHRLRIYIRNRVNDWL